MQKFFSSLGRVLSCLVPDKSDVLLCMGMSLLFYGIHLMYPPLAHCTIGLLTMILALMQVKKA